ncbi:A disintegrin and metalloproteinase with thrombospondin motifs 20, partial [Stegodyphus mimosarum]
MCNGISTLKPICVRLSDQYPVNDNHCANHLKPRLQKTRKCNEYCVLKWQDVSKAECSVQCGRGKRNKMIKCMKEDLTSHIAHVVPEEHCQHLGPKPSSEENCWGSCLNSSWIYSDWSECSVTCGKGVQHRSSECQNSENIKQPDSHCDPSTKVTSRECDQGQCPYWSVGNWTACSVTCGSGIKSRPLWCQHEKKYVDSRYCKNEDIPNTTERCTVGECYFWDTEEWESCSVSCGEGVSKRRIYCRSSYEEVNDSHCIHIPRPAAFKNCSTGIPCASNIISKENISEQHIRERMRTQRIIGHTNTISEFFHAVWMEGDWTKCSNSCGEGTKRRTVTCNNLDDGSRLPPGHCDPKLKPKIVEKCFSQECN